MTKTLTDYRTLVLGTLGDPTGRRYSNSMVDLALDQALAEWGCYLPGMWTISGLNRAATTTINDEDSMTLTKGAAAYAMEIRARSVTEVFGKRPEDTERLIEQADRLKAQFETELAGLSSREFMSEDPWPEKGWRG